MLLSQIVKSLNLTPINSKNLDIDITNGYCSDLLSDVLGKAKTGDIWITNQKHKNCIAIASLLELGGVVIVGGVDPDESTIEKALVEDVPLFTSNLSAFEAVGRLYELGIKG